MLAKGIKNYFLQTDHFLMVKWWEPNIFMRSALLVLSRDSLHCAK